eukprot:Tbor_TRINITY_DN5952_c0_g1::TRINITY_DN5952_c0_g1_i8::g.18339::m.18339
MKMNRYTHFPSLGILLVTFLVYMAHTTAAAEDHQIPFKKLGCFTDKNKNNKGFLEINSLRKDINIINTNNITDSCITHCQSEGALFAAVSNHTICSCGVTYDSKKKTSDSVCNIQCDKDFTCGGPSAATLYQIIPKNCTLPNSDGYIVFGESCYRLEKNNMMEWEYAERKCVSEKGHLASVHSAKENYFILSLFTAIDDVSHGIIFPSIWAGGVYRSGTKGFTWTDGSVSDFDNWRFGQPSLNSKIDMCLNMKPDETNGTWITDFCIFTNPFVCKRPIKDSIYTSPNVYQVLSGATTTCIPTNADKYMNNSATALALYPLMVGDVTGMTVQGRAPIPVSATYTHFNIKSNPDKNTNPIFVTDSARNLKVMKFDGTGQLIANGPREAKGSEELSVAAWVNCAKLETAPLEMVIVSKSKWRWNSVFDKEINFAWALTIDNGSHYCLQVGALKYCTVDPALVRQGVAQHVTAIYFGAHIEILVNGKYVNVKASSEGLGRSVPDSDFPLVIGGAYQASPKPGIPDSNFQGELHDVRVYAEALQSVDIDYLYSCTDGVTTDVIHLYEGVTAQLELQGRELNVNQSVGLSVTPCKGAATDKQQSPVSMAAKGTFSTDVTIPGAQIRKPSYFYPSNTDVSYYLCIGLQSTPNHYNFSAGAKIMITRLSSVEQQSKAAIVEISTGKTVDTTIHIGGYGLADGQLITLSSTPNCVSQVTESAITNTNTKGENATVRLRFNAQTAIYHLCWKDKGD